ncbi:MAG: peptidoglycan-binding domain-containing protein, partial [Candidatus Berkelbacteria bacterium]|nr:peptidoglycan-binding domain-containing protein [Candidatus Berkelbacteria bacterium]
GMITDVIANVDGYYKWTIPMTLPDGNDYYIRVVDGNYTGGYDDTDSPFSIVASVTQTPVPTITPIPSVSTSPTPIPTPTPTPAPNNPGTLSISGRFINTFTKLPLTNVAISTDAGNIYSNANGEFSFSTTTTDVTTAHSKGIPFYTNCYLQLGHVAAIFRNSDNSLYLKSFLFDLVNGDRTINPLTTNNVALGDVPLWPSKTITVNSDIPVQLYIGYPEEGRSVGNSLYKTQQILSNVVPLEYNTTVRLTDGTGNVYYSPVHRYSLQDGCSQAVLNFSGGQFAWDSAVLTPTPTPTPTPISCAPITVSVSPATPQLQNASPGQNGVSLVIFNVATNCNINLNSFAVSLLPMPNGYQNISSLRLYNNATGTQLGSTVTASVAGLNFTGLNQSISSNQTLSLKVVGDISPSAIVGSTVYGVFGGSSATDATTGTFVGNNASGNLIAGNVITIVAPITRINQSNNLAIFSRNLTVGSTGSDVKQLQALLINEVGYSADLITGYFGRITRDAVKKLQEKYGIKPVYGYFGEITRRALNALISGR